MGYTIGPRRSPFRCPVHPGRKIVRLRRSTVKPVSGYATVVWVLLQATDLAIPLFDLPEWLLSAILLAAFLGFPVIAALYMVWGVLYRAEELE